MIALNFEKYNDFLTDNQVYDTLEKKWTACFIKMLDLDRLPHEEWCFPFYKTTFSNGYKMRDGNPIFSAKSISRKTIRVIQEDSFATWQTPVPNGDGTALELVIVCTLHKAHIEEAKRLIHHWISV